MTPPTKAQLLFTLILFLACPPSQGELGIEWGWTLEASWGEVLPRAIHPPGPAGAWLSGLRPEEGGRVWGGGPVKGRARQGCLGGTEWGRGWPGRAGPWPNKG